MERINSLRNFTNENNIERILEDSVQLFFQTGMPELAEKWEKILLNYRKAKVYRNPTH